MPLDSDSWATDAFSTQLKSSQRAPFTLPPSDEFDRPIVSFGIQKNRDVPGRYRRSGRWLRSLLSSSRGAKNLCGPPSSRSILFTESGTAPVRFADDDDGTSSDSTA